MEKFPERIGPQTKLQIIPTVVPEIKQPYEDMPPDLRETPLDDFIKKQEYEDEKRKKKSPLQ